MPIAKSKGCTWIILTMAGGLLRSKPFKVPYPAPLKWYVPVSSKRVMHDMLANDKHLPPGYSPNDNLIFENTHQYEVLSPPLEDGATTALLFELVLY